MKKIILGALILLSAGAFAQDKAAKKEAKIEKRRKMPSTKRKKRSKREGKRRENREAKQGK